MKIYNSIEELIGNTPLVRASKIEKKYNLNAKILLKLERFNPAGSIKDRPALYMIADAIQKGKITKGATLIEPTSGNTGIGLAAICAYKGFKLILTMPDTMSVERIKIVKAYGAEVVLTDGKLGMQGSVDKAFEIQASIPNSMVVGQFYNPANIQSHYETTAKEIYEDTDGTVDAVVCGLGTCGTFTGIGRYLKEKNKNINMVGVEPLGSPKISKGKTGLHKIQGIGANFFPYNFDATVMDEIICSSDEDAYKFANELAKEEGILVGISSGASLFAGVELARREEYKNKTIVVILPDMGERYLSTDLFD